MNKYEEILLNAGEKKPAFTSLNETEQEQSEDDFNSFELRTEKNMNYKKIVNSNDVVDKIRFSDMTFTNRSNYTEILKKIDETKHVDEFMIQKLGLEQLVESIKNNDLLYPIYLKKKNDEYVVVVGTNRSICIKYLVDNEDFHFNSETNYFMEVSESFSEEELRSLSFRENINKPLKAIDIYLAIYKDYKKFGMEKTQEIYSLKKTQLYEYIALAKFPPKLLDLVIENKVSVEQAKKMVKYAQEKTINEVYLELGFELENRPKNLSRTRLRVLSSAIKLKKISELLDSQTLFPKALEMIEYAKEFISKHDNTYDTSKIVDTTYIVTKNRTFEDQEISDNCIFDKYINLKIDKFLLEEIENPCLNSIIKQLSRSVVTVETTSKKSKYKFNYEIDYNTIREEYKQDAKEIEQELLTIYEKYKINISSWRTIHFQDIDKE